MEKEIALIHTDLSLKGGGERVCVSIIEALNKEGVIPSLFTFTPTSDSVLGNYYDKKITFHTRPLLPFNMNKFGIYKEFIAGLISPSLNEYDVVMNTGAYTPFSLSYFINKIYTYIYNPVPFFTTPPKYQPFFWRLYLLPKQSLLKRSISHLKSNELLAVSDFTRLRIKKYWNKDSITMYPPVDTRKFNSVSDRQHRDGVISIGRFSPEKNHRLQLEIAKNLPALTFRLCGSASTPSFKQTFNEIKSLSEEMGLKNVELYPNLAFNKLTELMANSKFFLHTMVNEDFGLTPCEAIIGGCLPIVHNSGGSCEVVPYRSLRYNNLNEAVGCFKNTLNSNDLLNKLKVHVNLNYSETTFQNRMIKMLLS